MRKFKLLAIFLIFAVIGLADMSKSSVSSSDIVSGSDAKNAIYISNGSNFTKYKSSSMLSQDIISDIKSIMSDIKGKTIYVRDDAMYQKLRNLGASDITSSSDNIVKSASSGYGYKVHMVRF